MTLCSDIGDYSWLTTPEARAILDELTDNCAPLHTAVARLRDRVTPRRTHLILEQIELRRRAAAKFTQAHRLFLTRMGLEQTTDEWIARYKAQRFATRVRTSTPPAIADFCCGIGGDSMALAEIVAVVGVERDPVTAHFAAANSGAEVRVKDVTQFDLGGIAAWHIDPDRRASGRRTTSLQSCEPTLLTIERLLERVPHAGIKLAPATRVPAEWSGRCELEWISRDRECRQLIAWHGDLATVPGQHRATIIVARRDSDAGLSENDGKAPRTITGAALQTIPIAEKPDRYVFDIDAAVLAARLQGALAAECGLHALTSGSAYLTGPRPIADAALACFAIEDILPVRTRTLAQHLRHRGIGRLEVKKRGVDVDPERLRRELKLRGDNSATLLVSRIAGRPAAILAHRVE